METASTGGHLTIVGLGPGSWECLTVEASRVLLEAKTVYFRTAVNPALRHIHSHLPETNLRTFDELYETSATLDGVHERIVRDLGARVEKGESVVYAVPGSPSVGEATVRLLLERFRDGHFPIHIVHGVSFLEGVLAAVGVPDSAWIELQDASEIALLASENAVGEVPGDRHPLAWRAPVPTAPIVISQVYDRHIASGVKQWLGRFYPDRHHIRVVRAVSAGHATVETIELRELDRSVQWDETTSLFVPRVEEMDNVRTFAGLMQLTRRLRGPGGCPWDREQTHASLKPHLLEEAYEVLDALDANEPSLIAEELGDLLFQVTLHSQVAAEAGDFTVEDVIENIMRKLIGRHPHVFGDLALDDAQDVRRHWETFKQREKPKRASVLEQIPRGLPALPQSNLMQKRAAGVGFEWPHLDNVLDKVREELIELHHEVNAQAGKDEQREEYGDILFALVSVGRHLHLDPEEALRLANRKFTARFQYVEGRVSALGKTLRDLSPDELDAYWQEAKALGTTRHAETPTP